MTDLKLEFKNQKAITLIALVVTIIVLLILAGVSIQMLTGENRNTNQGGRSKRQNRSCRSKRGVSIRVYTCNRRKILK